MLHNLKILFLLLQENHETPVKNKGKKKVSQILNNSNSPMN